MKFGMLLTVLGFASLAQTMTLEYYGETSVANKLIYKKTTVGGLSALVYQDKQLWALSDDKGKFGESRFYIFDFKVKKNDIGLNIKSVHTISDVPAKLNNEKVILDPEALVILPNGDLLISSENNNDKKPRIPPRLFVVSSTGKFKSDIELSEKFVPESLGKQEKGMRQNAGLEGLTRTEDGKWLFAANEAPLVTDESSVDESEHGSRIRILKFNGKHEAVAEFGYELDAPSKLGPGIEVFRGISEILAISEKKLLVMERGVRLHKTGWTNTVALYVADLSLAEDISSVKNLSIAKRKLARKTKILDLETDLQKERPNKPVQNFEGLSWGPQLPNKKKSLLIISDNNFSNKEITELLVFSVEGE